MSEPKPELQDQAVAGEVLAELALARKVFPAFHTPHEGYAVILEEVDELWREVQLGRRKSMRNEAIQVAAMAIRFVVDVCDLRLEDRRVADLERERDQLRQRVADLEGGRDPDLIVFCKACGSIDARLDTSGAIDCVACGATIRPAHGEEDTSP